MATSYKTPGVYVEEISKLPPSVAQVETAIPAFIGYTKVTNYQGQDLVNKPVRIKSLKEYEEIFGGAKTSTLTIAVDASNKLSGDVTVSAITHRLYYALQMYFANGGGPCYIISAGDYAATIEYENGTKGMKFALEKLAKEDEPTIIVMPDMVGIADTNTFYTAYKDALTQAANLGDRVVLIDVKNTGAETFASKASEFRTGIGNNFLSYGAAYYPWLRTTLLPAIDEAAQAVSGGTLPVGAVLKLDETDSANAADIAANKSVYHSYPQLYADIKKSFSKDGNLIVLPPSSAIAGVYAMVDSTRGVWKAPANVSLNYVDEPMVKIDDEDQKDMNVSDTGKSVNAIREFSGKGVLVWGARTLAGNDNEWRYISVRRFYNMVEESVKKASEPFVFEPNDANTWAKVKGMIENFLTLQWRAGALMGAKPDHAFFVHVGLGETMTALDIFEGRMIVEIGLAVVRPAEFIILRFSHKMIES